MATPANVNSPLYVIIVVPSASVVVSNPASPISVMLV